jgi:zinc D-Ala-D-Ala carboxypeptidase
MPKRPFKAHKQFQFAALIVITAVVTIWVGVLGLYVWNQMQPEGLDTVELPPAQVQASPSPPPISATPVPSVAPIPTVIPAPPQPTASTSIPNPAVRPTAPVAPANKNGQHFSYGEASPNRLVAIGQYYDRPESMVQEAADAFFAMKDAAANAGISLGPISGFRGVAAQETLFENQIRRKGSLEEALRWSAPPGFSEHHTGFTLDIRDLSTADSNATTDLKVEFADTEAFAWLQQNACSFQFELSFPENNRQGVGFEPWHWRFVGTGEAKQIFAAARAEFPETSTCGA